MAASSRSTSAVVRASQVATRLNAVDAGSSCWMTHRRSWKYGQRRIRAARGGQRHPRRCRDGRPQGDQLEQLGLVRRDRRLERIVQDSARGVDPELSGVDSQHDAAGLELLQQLTRGQNSISSRSSPPVDADATSVPPTAATLSARSRIVGASKTSRNASRTPSDSSIARQHPGGHQRMAAELEEVVVHADAFDAEQLAPDRRQAALRIGRRRDEPGCQRRARAGHAAGATASRVRPVTQPPVPPARRRPPPPARLPHQIRWRAARRRCRRPRGGAPRRARARSASTPAAGAMAPARCACQCAPHRVGHLQLGGHADVAPGAPVDGDHVAPGGRPRRAVDEGVEHGVGGGVVAGARRRRRRR